MLVGSWLPVGGLMLWLVRPDTQVVRTGSGGGLDGDIRWLRAENPKISSGVVMKYKSNDLTAGIRPAACSSAAGR